MQTVQYGMGSSGLFAELTGKISLQLHLLQSRAALLTRIRQERKQLLAMTESQLKDIGITRMQAIEESKRLGLPTSRV